jgi:mannitol/fructose-specific phosphotransferase system IIA component
MLKLKIEITEVDDGFNWKVTNGDESVMVVGVANSLFEALQEVFEVSDEIL